MPRDLRDDTALTADPDRPGRFHATYPTCGRSCTSSAACRCTRRCARWRSNSVATDLELVTANAIFLAPVPPGPITIDVEVLRNGRRASQVAADLRVPGVDPPALRVHGVFGAAHDTELTHQEVRFPEAPGPTTRDAGRSTEPVR